MNNILIIAEHTNSELKPATLHTITAAQQISGQITVLVAGKNCGGVAEKVAAVANVTKVLVADAPAYEHQLAENIAPLIVKIAEGYTHILAAGTTTGKNFFCRRSDACPCCFIIRIAKTNT